MKLLTLIGLLMLTGSNAFANTCYVQETTEHTFLVLIEDGPVLGEFQTLPDASNAVKQAVETKWCK